MCRTLLKETRVKFGGDFIQLFKFFFVNLVKELKILSLVHETSLLNIQTNCIHAIKT